jgi:hypothetical protein
MRIFGVIFEQSEKSILKMHTTHIPIDFDQSDEQVWLLHLGISVHIHQKIQQMQTHFPHRIQTLCLRKPGDRPASYPHDGSRRIIPSPPTSMMSCKNVCMWFMF